MLGSISQHSLHRFTLHFGDHRSARAALFPLFDDLGQTRALLFLTAHNARIRLIDFEADLFQGRTLLPRLRRQRINLPSAKLEDCGEVSEESLAELWHFDPWWELDENRYAGHPSAPGLKSTNLLGFDETITRVWFTPSLSRVTWLALGEGEGMSLKRFEPQILRRARRERARVTLHRPAPAHTTGWRLRPFWESRG